MQQHIPWKACKDAGYTFVWCKCVQGNDGTDPFFSEDIQGALNVGLLAGAYHFLYPLSHIDPKVQAHNYFVASKGLGSKPGQLPPALDCEWPPPEQWAKWGCTAPQISEYMKATAEQMEVDHGVKPVIYIYPWYVIALVRGGADLTWMKDYVVWMAGGPTYGTGKPPTDDQAAPHPSPLTDEQIRFEQFDGNGGRKLPNGVDADFNVFRGTMEELLALCGVHPDRPVDVIEGPAACS